MQFSWTIFTVVLLLGILQLAVGMVCGRCLPLGRTKSSRADRENFGRLRHFARRLFELVASVSKDVDHHHAEIEQVHREFSSVPTDESGGLSESVLKTVARIMEINERLQTRISDAEAKLQQQTEQMQSQVAEARTDPLTGLPNRRAFDDEMVRRIAEWRRKKTTFCLLMVDIDHFKRLNDQYGHPAGDYVLRHVAEVLGSMLREMDVVARIGGEEFAIVLPSTNFPDARRATERIRVAVAAEAFRFEQMEIRLTVSLGLAVVASQDDAVTLVKRADEALYAAKRGGRNCGYSHDGRTRERIEFSRQPSVDPSSPDAPRHRPAGPDASESSELTAICNQLRHRLAEMTEEP